MAFPEAINYDQLASFAYERLEAALKDWRGGRPQSEEPLMNRLTHHLTRISRSCDVGNSAPLSVRADIAYLHRQGELQRDKYGSDLAVTVYIDGANYLKTALFQLKVDADANTRLKRPQLEEALASPLTKDRSFVLHVERERRVLHLRLAKTAPLLAEFGDQQEKAFDCAHWTPFGRWLWEWLSCDTGEPSRMSDPAGIEPLLERYVVEAEWDSAQGRPWGQRRETDYRLDLPPVHTWLRYLIASPENEWLKK